MKQSNRNGRLEDNDNTIKKFFLLQERLFAQLPLHLKILMKFIRPQEETQSKEFLQPRPYQNSLLHLNLYNSAEILFSLNYPFVLLKPNLSWQKAGLNDLYGQISPH